MTRIFLTGGSGFIGAEIAQLAQADGHQLANFDLSPPHFPEQAAYWTKGDVRDAPALLAAVQQFQPDVIIHLASDIDVKITQLSEFTTTVDGTANTIAAARSVPGLRKFVHISTQFTVMPGVRPPSEEYLQPYTVYGEAKAETEKMMREADLTMPWLIVRPTIIWGPHHPSFRENIFKHIRKRTYLHPVGRTKTLRAFGYVTNTAEQILKLALAEQTPAGRHVYYVGDSTMDYEVWADAFAIGLTGRKAHRVPIRLLNLLGKAGDMARALKLPAPIDSGRAFRMSTSSAIDLSPTIDLLGAPSVSFEEGVRRTLAWLNPPD